MIKKERKLISKKRSRKISVKIPLLSERLAINRLNKERILTILSGSKILTKDQKLSGLLAIDRLRVSAEILHIVRVRASYTITSEEESFLKDIGRLESLKKLLSGISEAVYLELTKDKRKVEFRPIIVDEIKHPVYPSSLDKFRIIEFKAYQDTQKGSYRIQELIKSVVRKRYDFNERTKQYLELYQQISKELISNRFIDKDTGEVLFPLRRIQKYLEKREIKDPRKIRCAWCKWETYIFRPKPKDPAAHEFCYRPSCNVSYSRKYSKSL